MITNVGLKDVKWWEDSKSGLKIQIEKHLTTFLAKNVVKRFSIWIFGQKKWSNVFLFEFWGQIWNPLII